jgi:hypothetical protein
MAGHRQNPTSPRGVRAPGDFYEIRGEFRTWYISTETAVRISRALERRWRPRWIKFVDLHGARVWVRGDSVFHLAESTGLKRMQEHDFDFALIRENDVAYRRHNPECDSSDADGGWT